MLKIPPFRLVPEPLDDSARALPSFGEYSDEVLGRRHRLGGEPELIQSKDFPACPVCGEKMTFYAQLDSVNDEIMIADAGLVFLFICFDDYSTVSFIESY